MRSGDAVNRLAVLREDRAKGIPRGFGRDLQRAARRDLEEDTARVSDGAVCRSEKDAGLGWPREEAADGIFGHTGGEAAYQLVLAIRSDAVDGAALTRAPEIRRAVDCPIRALDERAIGERAGSSMVELEDDRCLPLGGNGVKEPVVVRTARQRGAIDRPVLGEKQRARGADAHGKGAGFFQDGRVNGSGRRRAEQGCQNR